MTEKMIARCGLICTECEAFLATQANDIGALTKLAEKAAEQFNMTMTWEDSICNGCLSDQKKIGYCNSCAVRACAVERGVENCAYCSDYGCETISKFWEMAPKAKGNLENIRLEMSNNNQI
jgi:hypothetical protein